MSKVVAILPTYKRKALTIETIKRLQAQTVKMEIIVIGSVQEDHDAAIETDVKYIEYPNEPSLGAKWQAGVDVVRQMRAEYLYVAGSDDWQSSKWAEHLIAGLGQGNWVAGSHAGFFLKCRPNEDLELYWIEAYKGTDRFGELLGPGRIFSKEYLDKIDWKLFPSDPAYNAGLDGYSFGGIPKDKVYDAYNSGVFTITMKADRNPINSFEAVINSSKHKVLIPFTENWIEKIFPGFMKSLEHVRNG